MASGPKRFRFGLSAPPPRSPGELAERARWAEAHGFSTLLVPDHLVPDLLDPFPSLAAAAAATTTLRVGTLVINNDLRHPVMLAREAASLDVVSGGRFELGIGAGHMASEYEQAGLTFDRGRFRVERLAESVEILRSLLAGEACTFHGEHYRVEGHRVPEPVQRPRPPLLIGGNGRMVHELAARRADAVGFTGFTHQRGGREVVPDSFHAEALDAQVARIRELAGERFEEIELNVLVQRVMLTGDRRGAVAELAAGEGWPDVDAVLESPYLLVGSADSMAEDLIRRRERFGVSYWAVFDRRGGLDLAPVVERLAGT